MAEIMNKIKVSEIFYSIQGEGKYMGAPSVFLRTFGCNFTCSGFGMPKGELSNERNIIASKAKDYKEYKSLPLVSTGCDSYASWDPRFKHLSPILSIDSIVDAITDFLPFKEWRNEHLVITGGEPLLGWQKAFPNLLGHNSMLDLEYLTFETNGTQPLSTEFEDWLYNYRRSGRKLTFSVSPKLSCSGEEREHAIRPEVISQYQSVGDVYLKFVVSTEEDVTEVEDVLDMYEDQGFDGNVYLMPVGGVEEVFKLNNRKVAEMAMARGWYYSDRLHVSLWKNAWGT
jgi:7-carboxy-7-deazaguanine synthase